LNTKNNRIFFISLSEVADNAGLSVEETGSSATESDSIGSIRNSSPENSSITNNNKVVMGRHQDDNNIKTGSVSMSRLSPMVTGNSTTKLQKQILTYSAAKHQDLGYHTLLNKHVGTCSTSSLESSETLWDVRATKTPIRDLKIMTHNAKHSPVSRSSTPRNQQQKISRNTDVFRSNCRNISNRNLMTDYFESVPDSCVVKILSFLNTNDLVMCSRISRRFYFLAWEPNLWKSVNLIGAEQTDTDLALKTIIRLLSRNSVKHSLEKLILTGCSRLTDRGLAIVARTCPNLFRLEIQHCVNITNGGLMDLVTKCQMMDHLDVTGKNENPFVQYLQRVS
jgi:hypothetical protein